MTDVESRGRYEALLAAMVSPAEVRQLVERLGNAEFGASEESQARDVVE